MTCMKQIKTRTCNSYFHFFFLNIWFILRHILQFSCNRSNSIISMLQIVFTVFLTAFYFIMFGFMISCKFVLWTNNCVCVWVVAISIVEVTSTIIEHDNVHMRPQRHICHWFYVGPTWWFVLFMSSFGLNCWYVQLMALCHAIDWLRSRSSYCNDYSC